MKLVVLQPKPPTGPRGTLVLAPSFAMSALATGLLVEVRARPIRRGLPSD